ncbi:MAG: hypothetical protein K2Y13_06125 [Burkholderiaceae bacterium]|uniref:HNH endonuclease n=1 Tax=Herminiimonas contaminans TaxID=1111140 RepID=A0ABS0EQG5_9BURK|nr:hypothetical protein [Herminiimonas contaminans]MBF8177026.1 hypothetical protein [Herminiimonas contaminans]MBX9799020.1 hypothetical protein [Burkholderiaceae bacterium]
MPRLLTQSQFQRWKKPDFCYLCGTTLKDGSLLNDDHCPPQSFFSKPDRTNYPIKLQVHERCNHKWHLADETMSIFLDALHGTEKSSNPKHLAKLNFIDIKSEQGIYQGITKLPIRPLAYRIIRCMHALLYKSFLKVETVHDIHYPIPEADTANNNKPFSQKIQTYQFSNELCTAQRTETHDAIYAYNGRFKYICTWHKLDNGQSICLFTFDIYKLHNLAVKIADYPRSVIGFYAAEKPQNATLCSLLKLEHPDEDILYPILSQ